MFPFWSVKYTKALLKPRPLLNKTLPEMETEAAVGARDTPSLLHLIPSLLMMKVMKLLGSGGGAATLSSVVTAPAERTTILPLSTPGVLPFTKTSFAERSLEITFEPSAKMGSEAALSIEKLIVPVTACTPSKGVPTA